LSELLEYKIDRFLGVNKSETETLLKLGEASSMTNWLITDDLKLKKAFGYVQLFASIAAKKINGMWYGSINGTDYLLFACNGHVYSCDLDDYTNTDLGTIVDSYPTNFFITNNTVYIMDGTDLYSWAGTGSVAAVTGYVPTVYTAAPPTGGGTMLEGLNYINGQKTMKFSGDNVATVYQLNELDVDSVDTVVVNGVTKTVTTDYAVDLVNGTVTFVVKPPTGVNNVVITWTKTDAADRPTITKNRYFGGQYYAMFWIFGNPDHKNTRYRSGVTMAGVSDPTYWPKFTDSDVGEYEITDIKTQYTQQIIYTNGDSSGASAWYSVEQDYTDPTTGIVTPLFPVFPMNAKVGNVAKGQVQIIVNNPFTIWKGIYEWVSTYVMNEKNAQWKSQRIQNDLDAVDLSTAITWDWDDKGVYIICVGKVLWCYNYRVNAWYILEIPDTPTCFTVIDQELYFGTTNGQLMKFDESVGTFNGTPIVAEWEMGYFNFDVDWLKKFVQIMLISILPLTETHVDIYLSTDRRAAYKFIGTASYALSNFHTWDFSNFSFATNYSPQPFNKKLRAKKINTLKIKLVNDGLDGATVLSITLPTRKGGIVKNRS
jgi:hypothetical protein